MSTDHIVDITQMVPGPDLDRLVAEKVMGWTSIVDGHAVPYKGPWSPSTNIAHAWELAGHVSYLTGGFSVAHYDDVWIAGFGKSDPCGCREFSEVGKTAPHAICLAALTCMGVTAAGDNA